MTEAAAAGIPPDRFRHLTYRELFNALQGEAIRRRRDRQSSLWAVWHGAAWTRSKTFTNAEKLNSMLRKMDPPRVMTPREQRSAILGIANAMGAEVVYRKKKAA